MFKKKKPTPSLGRQRPVASGERQSAAVFSYRASRSTRPVDTAVSSRGRDKQAQLAHQRDGAAAQRRQVQTGSWLGKKGPRTALLIAVVILVVCNLFLGTTPRLVTIQANDHGQIFLQSQKTYMQAAQSALSASPFSRTKFTINTKRVAEQLRKQFPEFADVSVSVPFIGTSPVVYVEPATPALLLSTRSGEVYILDTAGRALSTVAQAPKVARLGLPGVADDSGLAITLGRVALPSNEVAYITEVEGQLKAKHVSISSMSLPARASELDVHITGVTYLVKFNLQTNPRVGAGAYLAVKQQLEREHKTPSSYIDVRVDNRAYYK
jgi:hypothetical protein